MPNKIALLIGNSDFRDGALGSLAAPDDDVIALREILGDDACGFETVPKIGAGLIETQTAITDLFENRRRDDTLLIYYTGHGLRDDRGDLYLALPQTDLSRLRATALRSGFIREEMARSASERQVLILDCCHSGAVMDDVARKRSDQDNLVKTDFVDPIGYGKFVLTACSAQESAFERDGASIFTRHLVDGLRDGAAAPAKDDITIRDLYDYLSQRVPEDKPAMMPRLWASEQVRDLVIARNPDPRPIVPPEWVKLLWDADPHRAYGGAIRLIRLIDDADEQFTADILAALRQRLEQPETLSYLAAEPILEVLQPPQDDSLARRASELETELATLRTAHSEELDEERRRQVSLTEERDVALSEMRTALVRLETEQVQRETERRSIDTQIDEATKNISTEIATLRGQLQAQRQAREEDARQWEEERTRLETAATPQSGGRKSLYGRA